MIIIIIVNSVIMHIIIIHDNIGLTSKNWWESSSLRI